MIQADFSVEAMELALQVAGHAFPRLSRVGASPSGTMSPLNDYRLRLAAPDVWETGFFLTDVTRTAEGRIHLIEANGSNGALSSSGAGRDDDRARHMALSFKRKNKPPGQVVALLPYQNAFIHIGEFCLRARAFAEQLSSEHKIALRLYDQELADEDVSVVCGPISAVAPLIERRDRVLLFRGRQVVFATNTNLLPELVRLGTVDREGISYSVDDDVFHEGRCAPVVHHKGLQQDLAVGTGITPLEWREAADEAGWLEAVRWFRERDLVAVAKMNSGSGGAGVEIVTPGMSDAACKAALDRIRESARRKHGENAESTLFPVRLFQFAMARPYAVYGKPHLWDLRLQCLLSSGEVEVRPCVVRLAPQPFDGTYAWDSVVSNLTGRDAAQAMRYMRAPGARRRSQPQNVLEGLGMDEVALHAVMQGCAQWSVAAARWARSRQDGGY